MKFNIPSKTFLIGEYLALTGGPALVAATSPYFVLNVEFQSKNIILNGIHSESPAGRLLKDHPSHFTSIAVHFEDPHQGRGGFGASSAQFLGVYNALLKFQHRSFSQFDFSRVYRHYHSQGSGADALAQWEGYITLFEGLERQPTHLQWPFSHLGFVILRTGFKIATHIHLQNAQKDLPYKKMEILVRQAIHALQSNDDITFSAALKNYGKLLESVDLLHPTVKPLIEKWQAHPGVTAAKGCGAFGADVILIVYDKNKCSAEDFEAVGTDNNLVAGLHEQN